MQKAILSLVRPKIFPNCKLFTFDRDTREFGEIDPDLVNVRFEGGRAIYEPKDASKNLIIIQAMNIKKASATMLTIIVKEKKE